MVSLFRRILVVLLAVCLPAVVLAQSASVTDVGVRLAPAYAQMLNLTLVPDISTARYTVDDGRNAMVVDVTRFPVAFKLKPLGDNADLYARATGGRLEARATFPVTFFGPGGATTGGVATRWTAYGLSAGLGAKVRLGQGFTVEPALDVGVTRLVNGADYSGSGVLLQPVFDGTLFNWGADAWVATPQLGFAWKSDTPGRDLQVQGHVAWSRIASYGESVPAHRFNESAGVWSLRGAYSVPTRWRALDRPLEGVVYGGYSGFFGPHRSALGFSSVSEIGLGVQAPLATSSEQSRRLRVGASYLFGPHLRGWAVSFGMNY